MSFTSLMVHLITTYRMKSTIGGQFSYSTNLVNTNCMIQPVSAEFASKINEVFGRTYHLFVPINTDIQIGDKIIDQIGKEYRITGSLNRNYGRNPHLTFIMTEEVKANPDQ